MMRFVTIIALLADCAQGYRVNSKKLMTANFVQAGANETLESSALAGKQAEKTSAEVKTWSTGHRVSNLYTFGAPGVSEEPLEDPKGSRGCFPGKRVVNQDKNWLGQDKIDTVPVGLNLIFKHPKMDALALWDNNRELYACGSGDIDYDVPSLVMHLSGTYIKRFPDKDVDLALSVSYEDNENEARKVVQNYGFELKASAEEGEEVSHLIWNPRNGHCFLTFEGSDDASDWVTNGNIGMTDFCGLGTQVHQGFKEELMKMVELPDFQNKIRPGLSRCRKLDVVGHSLGGAIATLFTACAHSERGSGTAEYEQIKF